MIAEIKDALKFMLSENKGIYEVFGIDDNLLNLNIPTEYKLLEYVNDLIDLKK